MGNAVRMVGDAPELDPLPAHELARGVVEHLVGIHVAVVVRRRHGLGVEIVRSGAEAAHHEPVALKGLVHWRRLVDAPDDRLEVVDVEGPRIEVSVPAHHVEGVVVEDDLVEAVVLLHQNRKVSPLVVDSEQARPADVALAVGRALDELAELVAVPLGPADVPAALEDQQLGRLCREVESPPVHDAPVNDEVVTLAVGQVAEHRLERACALGHIDQLVGLRVPIKVGVVLVGLDVQHRDVLVEQERDAVERGAAPALHL